MEEHLDPAGLPSEDVSTPTAAPTEAVLAERLAIPSSVEALYLEEASIYRPVCTGDIFRGVAVPGSTSDEVAHDLTMIVAHPSAMREGAALASRAQAAPVPGVRRTEWTPDRFDIFPLPGLQARAAANGVTIAHRPWAADLRLAGPIATDSLDVRQRVVCLSPEGIVLLLQRLVHTSTRAAVRIDTLTSVFGVKLEEVELLETWTEATLGEISQDEAVKRLPETVKEFEAFLQEVDERTGMTLRGMFEDPLHRGQAQRAIFSELRRREPSR